MPSPVEEAQAEGYSSDEINDYLAPRMAQAQSEGYSQGEINDYLGIKPPPPFDEGGLRAKLGAGLSALAQTSSVGMLLQAMHQQLARPKLDAASLAGAQQPVTSIPDVIEAGLQGSSGGLLYRGMGPDKVIAPDAPWTSRLAGQAAGMVGDVPAMAFGAVAGAPGGAFTSMAGAFAMPTLLRESLMDAYQNGQFKSFPEFWGRVAPILLETAKSYVTGLATAGAGKAVEAARGTIPGAIADWALPGSMTTLKTAAEIAAMTTVGRGLEGQVPTAQDFADAAVMLGGVKFAEMGARKLRQVYAKTGVPPAAVVADAAHDVSIQQDLMSDKPVPDAYAAAVDPPFDIAAAEKAKLIAAGRPEDEAEQAAALVASHYEARAARFGGAKGSAADLYRAELETKGEGGQDGGGPTEAPATEPDEAPPEGAPPEGAPPEGAPPDGQPAAPWDGVERRAPWDGTERRAGGAQSTQGAEGAPAAPATETPGAPPKEPPQSLVPAPPTQPEPVAPSPHARAAEDDHALAERIADRLEQPTAEGVIRLSAKELQSLAENTYGGTLASGAYSRDRLYDALELGVNRFIQRHPERFNPAVDAAGGERAARELAALKDSLPTQTVRAGEKDAYQQFSTPPDYAYAANWVANLRPDDHVLEPSAGVGGLIVHAMNAGVRETTVNELSDKRRGMIAALNPTRVAGEDAAQLHNILPAGVRPTVVVMNPPFSRAAERMGGKMVLDEGAKHIEQALARLEPGGRLVAIVGEGMKPEGTAAQGTRGGGTGKAFAAWWNKIAAQYDVRANVGVDRTIYTKYGTSFPTRLLVIDKNPPSGRPMVTGQAPDAAGLIERLKDVRDERGAVESVAGQSDRPEMAAGGEGLAGPASELHSPTGGMGAGEGDRGDTQADVTEPAGTPQPGVRGERGAGGGGAGSRTRQPMVPVEPEPRTGRTGSEPRGPTEQGDDASGGGIRGSGDGIRSDGSGERDEPGLTPAPEPVLATENALAEPDNQAVNEAVYEAYKPQRVQIVGAKPHPGALVQSAAMATVMPPPTDYKPRLPAALIKSGALSDAQTEAIVYAGHAHSDVMADGKRRGFFIGDGTGVGKGREIAGIILDNFQNGRTKAVWVSEKRALVNDAKRDWAGLGRAASDIIDHGKLKPGDEIKASKGILFSSYDTLKSAEQTKTVDGKIRGKERVDQIIEWLGKDFDGVIAFDEAHNMGNSTDQRGTRGVKRAAQKALAAVRLQQELPNARVLYVSATGATEVSNLAYADRLGLWGEGTAFPNRDAFIRSVSSGGIAGMELVARDMKALGHYIARNLSYDGVDYDRVEHVLSPDQRSTYDGLAKGWQLVLQHFNAALEITGATDDGRVMSGRAKSSAMSAFWGAHQRFFNQIITSMQMPSVIRGVEADLKAGRQAVLQLVNTMEAAQERALEKARASGEGEIESLDMTPRDQLMQLIEKSYPVQQMEEYVDDNGNIRSRLALDSEEKPVINKEAVEARERLLDQVGSLRVPDGPLEMLLNHFSADKVAEVTGRKQRVIRKPDEGGQMKTVVEQRGAGANIAEADAFQHRKKPILVFSEAGGTGRSYHDDADIAAEMGSSARRSHYLVQGGWRADKAVQGFGRDHRTNQASAPIFHLVTTDLQGQKRFISSIARRLAQLGALTKGERRAADQGMFGMRDNLESTEARDGLIQFFKDVNAGAVDGVSMSDLEESMGLKMHDENGALVTPLPEMSQFLNRVLSLTIDHQNQVFQAFSDRMDLAIDRASAAGTLDTGVETYKADKISKQSEQTVYTDPRSGAETKHVQLNVQNRNKPISFAATLAGRNKTNGLKPDTFIQSQRSGRVFAVTSAGTYTDADGRIVPQVRLTSPIDYQLADRAKIDRDNWKRLTAQEAKPLWDQQVKDTPEFRNSDLHLITGAVLPIWDRLGGNPKIFRLQTDEGERMLGRVVPSTQVNATLRNLGAEAIKVTAPPAEIAQQVLNGATARLANEWTIKRSMVAGEPRIELVGPDHRYADELARSGVFSERIAYATRYFIPTEPGAAAAAIEGITKSRPVTALEGGGGGRTLYQRDTPSSDERPAKGRIDLADGHAVITLMRDAANASTAIHEYGHAWLEELLRDAADPQAPTQLAADAQTVRAWLGAGPDERISNEGHEQFARGFEQYLREGQAPSSALARVFEQFKQWLSVIYRHVQELGVPISDEMRQVFDRIAGTEQEAAPKGPGDKPGDEPPAPGGEPAGAQPAGAQPGLALGAGGQPPTPPPNQESLPLPSPQGGPPATLADANRAILSHLSIGEAAAARPWTFARLYTDVVNKLFPIERAVSEAVGKNVLPVAEDAGKLARLMSGASGIADRFLRYNTLDFATRQPNGPGLETILAPVRDDLDGFRAFAAANRALELAEREIPTGFDLDAARMVAAEGEAEYGQTLAALIEFQNRTATYLRDAGVLSAAGYDAMREANRLYVPFQRVMEADASGAIRIVGSFQARNPINKIVGSQRAVIDPIESIIRNTYLFTQMAERNQVGTALINMLEAGSEAAPGHEAAANPAAGDALRAEGIADADALEPLLLSLAPVREGEIRIMRDGGAKTYRVDPELARAMKGLDAQSMGDLEKLLRPFANALRAGAVLQPDFVLRHSIRDFLYAAVTHPGFFSPLDMLRGFTSLAIKDADYQDWLSSGGAGVSMVSLDRRYLQTSIAQLAGTGILARAWNVVDNPNASLGAKAGAVASVPLDAARKFLLSPMQAAVTFAESATHIGAFIKAKNQMLEGQPEGAQLSKEQTLAAGWASRDIAVDAARMGAKVRTLNALSAFSNIIIQDTDRVVRAFIDSPMSTAIKVAGVITLPSVLTWISGQGDPRYDDAPDWERDLFWVLPTDHWQTTTPADFAGRADNSHLRRMTDDGLYQVNNGATFRIPKPWGMGLVFGSGMERSLDSLAAHKPDAFKGLLTSMGAVSLPSLIPNAITPIIEQFANRSMFTNRTLVPDQMEKLLPEYQYTPYTSETAKALGEIIGAFPGVEQAKTQQGTAGGVARALSSPILMENYLRAWSGNLGMYALQLADLGLRKAGVVPDPDNLPARTLADIPFVRAFIVRSPTSSAQSIQDFQDEYGRNKIYYDTMIGMAKEGNADAMRRVQQAGGPAIFVQLDGMHTALAQQAKMVRDIYKNPSIPADEKRQLIDTTYWRMSEIAQAGSAALAQARTALGQAAALPGVAQQVGVPQ